MSEFLSLPENLALQSIAAAVAAGVQAPPDVAAAEVIDRLTTSFGPVVQQIIALIESGVTSLPGILQAIAAAGAAVPAWVLLLANILLAIVPKPAA